MASIDFPSPAVHGNTYPFLGVTYTYIDPLATGNGFWDVLTPGSVGIAIAAEINAKTDPVKYITPLELGLSDYRSVYDLYPVGTVYENYQDGTNPQTLLNMPSSTWVNLGAGRVLIGAGTSTDDDQPVPESQVFANAATGGEFNHTTTEGEMPSHKHNMLQSAGTGGAGNQNRVVTDGGFSPITSAQTMQDAGNDEAHNNLQPYLVVYRWARAT